MSDNDKNINVLIDNVGRTIVGKINKLTPSVEVANPAIVNIEVRQDTGQIAVQLIPYLFREFAANEQDDPPVWSFAKDTVVLCNNLKVSPALIKQYNNVFNQPSGVLTPGAPEPQAESQTESEPEVVKLFDD